MRYAVNLVITVIVLLFLNAVGWLSLVHGGVPVAYDALTFHIIGPVLLVAILLWLISTVIKIAFSIVAVATLGVGLLLFPFIGFTVLTIIAHYMPGTLVLHSIWWTILCGFLLHLIQIDPPRKSAAASGA